MKSTIWLFGFALINTRTIPMTMMAATMPAIVVITLPGDRYRVRVTTVKRTS
jgi:hypothetical protein